MIRITFNSDGFHQLLCGEEVKALVTELTETVKDRADGNMSGEGSEGFKSKVRMGGFGGGRWVGHVATSDLATMIAESEDKALSKAVGV